MGRRLASGGAGGGGVTSVSATAPITTTGGATPTIGITAADETHDGSVTQVAQGFSGTKTFFDGVTVEVAETAVASLLALAGDFAAFGTAPALTGVLRGSNNAAFVSVRNAGGTADVQLLSLDASNRLLVGDATNAASIGLQSAGTGYGGVVVAIKTPTGGSSLGCLNAAGTLQAVFGYFSTNNEFRINGYGNSAGIPINTYFNSVLVSSFGRVAGDFVALGTATDNAQLNHSGLTFSAAVAAPAVVQTAATAGNGVAMGVTAQAAFPTGGGNGGPLQLTGGAKDGAGLRGPVQIRLNGTTEVMVEATEVVSGNRVLALARTAALTSTQMPANTGDGVTYVANAQTNPSANAVTGGILYGNAGAGTWRGSGGTTTAFGPA